MRRAIFVDRDGTINVDSGYVCKVEDFEFVSGAIEAMRLLGRSFDVFVVTNQSGIGRGYYTLDDMQKVHEYMLDMLRKHDAHVKGIFYCPHDPDVRCGCRKPELGMITQAEAQHGPFDYSKSWVIGDKLTDAQMGIRLGAKVALLRSRYWNDIDDMRPEIVSDSLLDVAKRITDTPCQCRERSWNYIDDGVYLKAGRYHVNVRIQDGVERCGEHDNLADAKEEWVKVQKILNGNEFTVDQVPISGV